MGSFAVDSVFDWRDEMICEIRPIMQRSASVISVIYKQPRIL